MKIKELNNTICLEILGCEPQRMLNACAMSGIALWNIRIIDSNTISADASESDLVAIEAKAGPSMCDIKTMEKPESIQRHRHLGIIGILVSVLSAILCISSLFVWDLEIEGNSRISDEKILKALSRSGMDIGTFWPVSDADKIRTQILLDEPDIEWITVNLHASRAEVLVLERTPRPKLNTDVAQADLTAGCDGIVSSVSVLDGTGLVSTGQAVSQGDVLISGTVNSTFGEPRTLAAKGRVDADTWRSESAVIAPGIQSKGEETGKRTRFAVRFGKKRINFYINSGNDIDGCDKITTEYGIGMKELFSLPLSIVKEELIFHELGDNIRYDRAGAKDRLVEYLQSKVDGQIVSFFFEENGNSITLNAHCLENIALQTIRGKSTVPGKDTYDRTGD